MSDETPFEPPVITDEDVRSVSCLLFSQDDAFHGETGTDPRQNVLKSMERIDVAACPGSGKTTLLVAKLAILAEKWQHRTRGICVLSHTNAARHGIESRLGNTAAGQRLLAYPHFIGTIHEFVGKFLAIPWLRSRGFPIRMIDDDEVEKRRRALIAKQSQFLALRRFVQNKEKHANLVGTWIVASPEFTVLKSNGNPAFKTSGPSASQLTRLVEMVARDGYHRYSEMFMWAGELMDKMPSVVDVLRDRFPMLFLDEAQDNSEEQSKILHRIFLAGNAPVRRQRFGDGNQAIFNFAGDEGATSDTFPDDTIKKDLPNSYRFGPNIAQLASPLGVAQYDGGLIGQGPSARFVSRSQEGAHTIYLFDNDSIDKVLPAYAQLLIETFKEELPKGIFTAVGHRHTPPDKEEKHKFPHHIGHYWPDYDPELSKTEPKPQTFVQYVSAGQAKADEIGEAYPAVEKIAAGILRLAAMAGDGMTFRSQRHNHRQVMSYLEESTGAREGYLDLVADFARTGNALSKEAWDKRWREIVLSVGEAVSGGTLSGPDVESFLGSKDSVGSPLSPSDAPRSSANIYRYSKDGRQVAVHVGSIHSVKGETHTATLVLETFWQDTKGRHNLELLLPWLKGIESGAGSVGILQTTRLKLHYVAMTRPTHLLCLAMKRSTFENAEGKLDQNLIEALKRHGWRVKMI